MLTDAERRFLIKPMLMKILKKYPQRAIKIRDHFPQWSFTNSAPGATGVDFT